MADTGSFIPQQATPKPRTARRRVYILSYVIYTFFIAVILISVGLVLWDLQLAAQNRSLQETLNEQRTRFEQSDIIRVQETESLLGLARYIIEHQPAVSVLLAALEDTTVSDVQLTDFSVVAGSANGLNAVIEPTVLVTYTGSTDTFNTLLAQRAVGEAHPILQAAQISGISFGNTETNQEVSANEQPVSYSVSLELPVSAIAFPGVVATPAEVEVDVIPTAPTATDTATESAESSSVTERFNELSDDPTNQ